MTKIKVCPLLTIAFNEAQGCTQTECQFWLGNEEQGDCSINLIARLSEERFQVSLI